MCNRKVNDIKNTVIVINYKYIGKKIVFLSYVLPVKNGISGLFTGKCNSVVVPGWGI